MIKLIFVTLCLYSLKVSGQIDDELQKLELQIHNVGLEVYNINQKLNNTEQELNDISIALENQLQRKFKLQEKLGVQFKTMYMLRKNTKIKLILNNHNISNISRQIALWEYISQQNSRQLSAADKALNETLNFKSSLLSIQDTLKQSQDSYQQQLKILKDLYQQRKDLLRNHQAIPKPNKIIESPYSYKIINQELKNPHQPLSVIKNISKDRIIQATQGSEVYAIANAKVVFADWLRGYGFMLILDHGNGLMSLYGQNQSLLKETGDIVVSGELIALVGESGGQDDPGLYFEIRKDGKPIKLDKWLKYET